MSTEALITFVLASALLSIAPGPDNLFVLMQSAIHGSRAGLLVTLGLCTGLLAHTALVAFGVAALLLANEFAFLVLKLAGAGYLLYLALRAWQAGASTLPSAQAAPLSSWALYRRGILMNLSNPKVALFFLAFLPQFASPESQNIAIEIIGLSAIFILIAALVFSLVALLAGWLAKRLVESPRAQARLNRMAALVFAALAMRLAVTSA